MPAGKAVWRLHLLFAMLLCYNKENVSEVETEMMDPRVEKLARTLIGYSTRVQPGENVLIEAWNGGNDLVKALVREVCLLYTSRCV